MKQCPECNRELNDDVRYCATCGYYFGDGGTPPMGGQTPPAMPQPMAASQGAYPTNNIPQPQAVPLQYAPGVQGAAAVNKPRSSNAGRVVLIGIIAVIAILLFSFVSCVASCASGGGGGVGGGSGSAVSLNTDTREAEDAVKGLLDAAKRGDEGAVSKYYLGDPGDFAVEVASPNLVTEQDIYDDIFREAFGYASTLNGNGQRVRDKINKKLHDFDYEIIGTMPLGNMLERDLAGAKVRVRVNSTYVRWAEEYAEYDMIRSLIDKLGEKGMETFRDSLLGEYRNYGAADWVKMIGGDTIEWLNDSVEFYYSALDGRLDEAPKTSEQLNAYIDFFVVRDGGGWKVAQASDSDLYYVWGGFTGKFEKDPPKAVGYSKRAEVIPETVPVSGISMSPSAGDPGKLSDVRDAAIDGPDGVKATNVKYGRDSIGRWVVVGEIENTGEDADIALVMMADGTDSGGYPFEGGMLEGDMTSSRADEEDRSGASILFDVKHGEKRSFVLYPTYQGGRMSSVVADIQNLTLVVAPDVSPSSQRVNDDVQVSIESVSYDLLGATTAAPSLVISGKMRNTGAEEVSNPVPEIVFSDDGIPLPTLNKEEDGYVYGAAMTGEQHDGRTELPRTLAPGEEAEFTVHCEVNWSSADGVFLHCVSAK